MSINNSLDHLQYSVMFDVAHWADDENSAWIYGIVVGWPDVYLPTLAKKFRWNTEKVELMMVLHADFVKRRNIDVHDSTSEETSR